MEIGRDHNNPLDDTGWLPSGTGSDAHTEEQRRVAPSPGPSSRAVFAGLAPAHRTGRKDNRPGHPSSIGPSQAGLHFDPRDVPLVPPALKLADMRRIALVRAVPQMDVYQEADGTIWGVSPCPGPVCNTLVTGSIFFRRSGLAAMEYRHVEDGNNPPAIAWRALPELNTSLELLRTPELARTNGTYEGHMLDEWLGFDLVGSGIGIDPASKRAVRINLHGLLTHDELGNRKQFDLDNWRFGSGTMPDPDPDTHEIFRALPRDIMEKGARHVVRYTNDQIAEIVTGNYRYDDGKQPATRLSTETVELLAGRREQMRAAIFGSRGGSETAPEPLTSVVPHDDPAIEYLRHASWPLHAVLEFIKLQFPEAVFYIDTDGTKETISPGSRKRAAINAYGFEIEDDQEFVSVYRELDDLSMVLLSHYGKAGLMRARPNADAALPPVIFSAAEKAIIAAGDPLAPRLHVYVFVPDEKKSPFTPDPLTSGAFRINRPFKPLLVLPARPNDARPDMYLMSEPLDQTHPHYWENLLGKGSPLETMVFGRAQPLPLRIVNGVPLNRLSAREFDEMRGKYAPMNAHIDKRHLYASDYASVHRASAIMLELDKTIWLVKDPETAMWRLPKQSVESNGPRAKGAFEAAYKELGFAGPILGHVGDFKDERTSTKTRCFISRRHAGAPQALTVARVSIETALSVVHDPADVAALQTLRSMLTFPDWHELAQADEARLITQPGALHDYERGRTTHPYSKLAVGVHRIYRRHKIARAPNVFRGRISVDGRDVFYTGRRIETYVSLPGKPLVKKTAIVFERDDARPDEPTVIVQGGGPGASPAWYLGGGLGPIVVGEGGEVVTNNHSLLLGARLLFIDALGTGDAFTDGEEEAYFNIDDDADVTAEFVMKCSEDDELMPYLKGSPIFAMGTSYGVLRWGRAIENLIDNGMTVGGVIFVSGTMSYQLIDFEPESAISYACALVPYAATARHHLPEMKARYPDEDAFLAEVEKFAFDDYLPAIANGTALEREDPERFSAIAQTLSDYIGLSPEFIKAKHLQISQMDFATMLVSGEVIAALDGRMKTSPMPGDKGSDPFAYVLDELVAKYQNALTKFLRNDVGYRPIEDPNRPYVVLNPLFKRWDWGKENMSAPRVQDYVIRTARKNRKVRWMVAAGKHDFRNSAVVQRYALNHMPSDVAERFEGHTYEGGHMFYMTDESARTQFIVDVLAFIKRQTDDRE